MYQAWRATGFKPQMVIIEPTQYCVAGSANYSGVGLWSLFRTKLNLRLWEIRGIFTESSRRVSRKPGGCSSVSSPPPPLANAALALHNARSSGSAKARDFVCQELRRTDYKTIRNVGSGG